MVRDMLEEVYQALVSHEGLAGVCVKSFERPESLGEDEPSIVLIPVSSPMQMARGSNRSLAKRFSYQVNVESKSRKTCKDLQAIVEKILEEKGFYQSAGDLEGYISHIGRYVDVRTYRGRSPLYADY